MARDRGATLRLGGGGGTISDSILGGWGIRHFFLLNLYNFKNIGGGGTYPPALPYSAFPSGVKHTILTFVNKIPIVLISQLTIHPYLEILPFCSYSIL